MINAAAILLLLFCPRCQGGFGDVCWKCLDEEEEEQKKERERKDK